MDLHRIATRVTRRFTAAVPEALHAYQDVLRVLTAIRAHGADLIDLVHDSNLSGPALEGAEAAIQAFTADWGPRAQEMESAAKDLKMQVGDQVVQSRGRGSDTLRSAPRVPS
jgi:hypothetical protein